MGTSAGCGPNGSWIALMDNLTSMTICPKYCRMVQCSWCQVATTTWKTLVIHSTLVSICLCLFVSVCLCVSVAPFLEKRKWEMNRKRRGRSTFFIIFQVLLLPKSRSQKLKSICDELCHDFVFGLCLFGSASPPHGSAAWALLLMPWAAFSPDQQTVH